MHSWWQALIVLLVAIIGIAHHFSNRNQRSIKTHKKIASPISESPQLPHKQSPLQDVKNSEDVKVRKYKTPFYDVSDIPLPSLQLLDQPESGENAHSKDALEYISRRIEKKLEEFGVQVKVVGAYSGPAITRFEIDPAVGVRGSQIIRVVKDLSRALSIEAIEVQETLPGKSYMALDIVNSKRQIVRLSELLSSQEYTDSEAQLAVALGRDILGKPVVADIDKMPHLLLAGTTGSGKSMAIDVMILSLLYKIPPAQLRMLLIDLKGVALSVYSDIPHLLSPVICNASGVAPVLNWCIQELGRRNRLFSYFGVRNIADLNLKVRDGANSGLGLVNPYSLTPENPEPMVELPSVVIFIDGLSDLMNIGEGVADLIESLTKGAAPVGIHLIMSASRLSVDVLTSQIKASVPARISFQVASKVDSVTILDQIGAEMLSKQGDMLYQMPGMTQPQKVHGAFVSDEEIARVVEYFKSQGEPNYIECLHCLPEDLNEAVTGKGDPFYDQAVEIVLHSRRASISLVQRHLRIGYNHAAKLIEEMEREGLVSPMQSNGNREVRKSS